MTDLNTIKQQVLQAQQNAEQSNHGHLKLWQTILGQSKPKNRLPLYDNNGYLTTACPVDSQQLKKQLMQLSPWRKGPFCLGDVTIESEWLCQLKWQRLQAHITPLTDKTVLDVGSGNGYFSLQMALSGANAVLAVEPFLLFYYQYQMISQHIKTLPVLFFPDKLAALTLPKPMFDCVFSMGVLYHQTSPIDHLKMLKKHLKPGGELVLETLVVDGGLGYHLMPKDRYANMANVWFIPSIATLISWLTRCGFCHIHLAGVSQTSPQEQRRTAWLGGRKKSLIDFLDANNQAKTIEGYPAPKRAMLVCRL